MATRERAECEDEISRTFIWSVPSLRVTRRLSSGLHDITVQDNDEESVTIETDDDTTNIYIREDISPSEATINFKLVEYFSRQFEIDSDDISLVHLVMNSAVSSLPGLLEKYDRYIPGGADDDDSDVDDSDSDTRSATSDEDNDGDRPEATNTETADDNFHSSVPIRLRNTPLLRDLVPSHQAITETIRQKAQEFRISESLVVEIPASLESASSTTTTVSLPTRSRKVSPKINRTLQVASSSIAMSHGGNHSKQLITVDENPAPSIRRTQSPPGPVDEHWSVADIRLREIGYRGELFVGTCHSPLPVVLISRRRFMSC